MNQPTKPFTRLTPEQWQQIIDQQMASGLSQKAFCQTQNISLATFTNWKSRLKSDAGIDSANVIQTSEREWIELPNELNEPPASPDWHIELELPGGVILRMRH
ncbi:transposase [Endozoicomonas sp. 4G]|uniref:IS66 family insertion sequence element accessory protein TnpA n=1 Tax=Endozoicomonas sp. 4G TaxID=2872754 RepID=UPI002078FD25|nr:transposase [Endozoicomonas sp. 4G]